MQRNYLNEYLRIAPISLALVRAIECRLLSKVEFKHPILDIGCGDGLFASLFFEDEIDEGIDISEDEIEIAKKRGAYKNLTVANALNLPYDDETFNFVFSNCVLEHIPPINDVLIEISRVLKNEGKLVFTVPSDMYGENLFFNYFLKKIGLGRIGKLYANKLNSYCRHFNLDSPEIWDQKLENAGFKVISCEKYLSPNATKIHDIMLIFSLIPMANKKIFGKMILFTSLRRLIVVPILSSIFNKFYEYDSENGSSLLIVAEKKG